MPGTLSSAINCKNYFSVFLCPEPLNTPKVEDESHPWSVMAEVFARIWVILESIIKNKHKIRHFNCRCSWGQKLFKNPQTTPLMRQDAKEAQYCWAIYCTHPPSDQPIWKATESTQFKYSQKNHLSKDNYCLKQENYVQTREMSFYGSQHSLNSAVRIKGRYKC